MHFILYVSIIAFSIVFFPTVREPIRKDTRPIIGLQPTSWEPLLSISLTHMCVATHFISCIIHKHTHTFSVLFPLPLHLHSKTPMLCSAAWPSLGLTTANVAWEKPNARKKICGHRIPTGWKNKGKKSIEKERDAEKVWTAAQRVSPVRPVIRSRTTSNEKRL